MGLFDSILNGLVRLLCGPRATGQPQPDGDVYVPPSVPHKPQQQRPQAPSSQPSPAYPGQQQQQKQRHRQQQHQSPSPPRHHGPRINQNQVNQENPHYLALRKRADAVADEMHKLSRESQEAFQSGNGALAKDLSNQSKAQRAELDRLNKEAHEWLFNENNKDSAPNEVDLHGLGVKEALEFTERAIQDAKRRGEPEIHLIVGKGLHSTNGPKIKPAVEELMVKYQLVAELDPQNAGVLIVSLDGKDKGTGKVIQSGEIAQRIEEGRDDRCVIM
ncbi:hypothetical protein BC835DRAFT_1420114 [Cytidiella melzeri]|nr:hypothetical protein BC835DRAFT_1420114 [Cytidiella melzeri]